MNKLVQYDIEYFEIDEKLKINIFDSIIIERYNSLHTNVRSLLLTEASNHDMDATSFYKRNNYYLYLKLLNIINDNINMLYNHLLTLKGSSIYNINKARFINIIKLETKRLSKIKKNIKTIANNSLDPTYINNILNTFMIDEETKEKIILSNIHNEVRKRLYDSISTGNYIDVNSLVRTLLKDYNISEESKENINEKTKRLRDSLTK